MSAVREQGADMYLRQIHDWVRYEDSILTKIELQLPSFITSQMNPHDWNNIPIPMVEAVDTLIKALLISENIFLN